MVKLKLGCDPEMFLFKPNGQYISAHDLFPGTKDEPHKVDKGAIQVDGLALEFNIDPAETAREFDSNIETVLRQIDDMLKKLEPVHGQIHRTFVPIANFNSFYFNNLPQNVKILGCDPDLRSSDATVIVKKIDLTNHPFRTAAGHVHVGWTEGEDAMSYPHLEDARFIANYFWEKDKGKIPGRTFLDGREQQRLQYYGGEGAFRSKPYGVELRSYSNIWVMLPESRIAMFNYITKNVQDLYKG